MNKAQLNALWDKSYKFNVKQEKKVAEKDM